MRRDKNQQIQRMTKKRAGTPSLPNPEQSRTNLNTRWIAELELERRTLPQTRQRQRSRMRAKQERRQAVQSACREGCPPHKCGHHQVGSFQLSHAKIVN